MKKNKNKLTNFLKIGVLLFGVSFLLWNCDKEELILVEEVLSLQQKRTSKSITFETLENTAIYKYFNEKLQLDLKTDKQLNHFEKGTQTTTNDLTIITQKVNQVINNGVETFSMFIKYKEQQENTYYNLVLYKKENTYRIYTLKIETSKKLHGKGTSVGMETDVTVQAGIIPYDGWNDYDDGDDATGGDGYEWQCWSVNLKIAHPCGSGGHHYPNGSGLYPQGCSGSPTTPYWPGYNYITNSDCGYVYIGSDSNHIDNGNDSGDTGGGNGGNNSSDTSDNVDVDAVNPSDVIPDGADSTDFINSVLSQKSPYNVDVTQVLDSISLPPNDSTKIANEKILCLYNKLTTSNTFKNLFTNVFGGTQDVLNVEFKVTKNLRFNGEKVNGLRTVVDGTRNSSTGKITKLNQLIQIDQDLLNGNYNAIKTIIHESIHAFLTLKKLNCNQQTPLNQYNNDDINETINTLYNNFCTSNQDQHDFMFNDMVPVFKTIFEEIGKLNFTSQASLDGLSSSDLQILNISQPNLNLNIPSSHMFSWGEFYFYNSLPGLHNTSSFETEIKNNPAKYDLFKAYSFLGKNKLSKGCN